MRKEEHHQGKNGLPLRGCGPVHSSQCDTESTASIVAFILRQTLHRRFNPYLREQEKRFISQQAEWSLMGINDKDPEILG